MKKILIQLLVALHLLPWAMPYANAATYYIADCQTVAGNTPAPGCTAGSNASGTPTNPLTPWQNTTPVQSLVNGAVACGDQFLFAKGGVWTNAVLDLNSAAATAGTTGCKNNPLVFGSYDPTLWSSTTKPILTQCNAATDLFIFDQVAQYGGYTIQDLDLDGCTTAFGTVLGQRGIVIAGNSHDFIIQRNTIRRFGNGIEGYATEDTTQRPYNCLVDSNTISRNARQGILWSCNYSVIENNTFDRTGEGCTGSPACGGLHNVYLSGAQSDRVVVRNNVLTNNVLTTGTNLCDATNLVVHGRYEQLDIIGNTMYQAPGTVTGGCWGIAVNGGYLLPFDPEYFYNVRIVGNKIINHSNFGLSFQGLVRPLVANNQFIQEAGSADVVGIGWADRGDPDNNDSKDIGAMVRQNTFYFAAPSNFNYGIYLQSYTNTNPGTQIQVTGNLMYFTAGASGNTCFAYDGWALANFTIANRNSCYFAGSGSWMSGASALATAQAAGFDLNSSNADPLVTLTGSGLTLNVEIAAGSPARSLADSTYFERQDARRCNRVAPDAGALEYFASACTPTPWPPAFFR
jgi:parallel beta-helix repeat protein